MFTSSIKRRIRWFYVEVVQWTSKKCSKKRDARAGLFFAHKTNWFLTLLSSWWWLLKGMLHETIRNDDF